MDHRKDGFVSIWVGSFKDAESLDSYVVQDFRASPPISKFGNEFKIGRYDEDGREASFKGELQIASIELFTGFSYFQSYRDQLSTALELLNNPMVNSVILIFDLKFEAAFISSVSQDDHQLSFLGAFKYR